MDALLIFYLVQEERQYAIRSFKGSKKDVMVASGVASKGLDFDDVQHVIIFTMPKEIEDYVHQIGRTGRSGKTGIATTFVNMNTPEQTLLDLKYLLMEAGQKVPPFLQSVVDPRAMQGGALKGCPVCGGKHKLSVVGLSRLTIAQGSDMGSQTVPSWRNRIGERWLLNEVAISVAVTSMEDKVKATLTMIAPNVHL